MNPGAREFAIDAGTAKSGAETIDLTDTADEVNTAVDDAGIRLEPFDRFRF